MEIISVIENLLPNPLTVITQLCATLVMFLVLKKLVWKPVTEIMNKRTEYEQGLLRNAEALKAENEKLKNELEEKVREANEQAQQTIEKAQAEGIMIRDELVKEGREKSKQLINEAEANIKREKTRMYEEMHDSIVEVALSATEKMLDEKVDAIADEELIDDFIKEVSKR